MNSPSKTTAPSIPERYLLELPPRKLDLFTQAVLLFGDKVSQLGWALFAAGSVFFWTTAVNSEARNYFEERNITWAEKAGVILQADSTGRYEGKEKIWQYRHSVSVEGRKYTGTSYSKGKKFDPGQIVFIRYNRDNPVNNHIIGLRRRPFSSKVDWLLILPLCGLLILLMPVKRNLRFLRLLKVGDFTRGRLIDKKATGRTGRHGGFVLPEFKYHFEFHHGEIKYIANCRTQNTDLVEDEETEIILYDRFKPYNNLVYDAVPNAPVINEAGFMEPVRGWRTAVLFLPVFAIAFNLAFLLASQDPSF